MVTLKWLLVVGLFGYCGLCFMLVLTQRSLMYFPERARTAPETAGLPQAEEIVLDTSDGEKVLAWHVPPRAEKPVVLYFHGNGGALHFRADWVGGVWWIASVMLPYGDEVETPTIRALVRNGRVSALALYVGAAGD